MAESNVVAVVTSFLALGVFLYIVTIFNGLIRLKVNIDKAWANIDVLLKQRHDEVPNLVAVVKGVKDFEQGVMEKVARARTESLSARTVGEKAGASKSLGGALERLFAVAENYPQLKAQENFLKLQERLSRIENAIADRRTFYNDSTAAYNSRIAQFPDLLVANLMKFGPKELFQVALGDKSEIKVDLSNP